MYIQNILISIFFAGVCISFEITSMYTGTDLQICQFLSTIHNDHTFFLPCIKTEASNLQVYTFIKTIANKHNLNLPADIMRLIMHNVCTLTYTMHESCYNLGSFISVPDVIINFIKARLQRSDNEKLIIHILKRCLEIHDISLMDIKNTFDNNIFRHIFQWSRQTEDGAVGGMRKKPKTYCSRILRLVAGNLAWQLISQDNGLQISAFFDACKSFDISIVDEFLTAAPNKEVIWQTICTPTVNGTLLLNDIIINECMFNRAPRNQFEASVLIIKRLLSYAPSNEAAQKLINTPAPKDGKTALGIAQEFSNIFLKGIESNDSFYFKFCNYPKMVDALKSKPLLVDYKYEENNAYIYLAFLSLAYCHTNIWYE